MQQQQRQRARGGRRKFVPGTAREILADDGLIGFDSRQRAVWLHHALTDLISPNLF